MQGLLTNDRTPSLKDFVASAVGVFGGYGLGTSGLQALDVTREYRERWFSRPAR